MFLKVCRDIGEVASSIHDANGSTVTTSFDHNGSVIFEIAECCLFL